LIKENGRRKNNWFIVGLWTFLANIIGFVFWNTFSYSQRLLRQPFLQPAARPADLENHETVEAKALLIAAANLRAGIEKRLLASGQEKLVLCAGIRNFREPWARDLGYFRPPGKPWKSF
jgi:hypothetical protein